MKKTILLIAAAIPLISGCYSPAKYPLQPGEKIIFLSPERASEFKVRTGNAPNSPTNRVVDITRPTWILCE